MQALLLALALQAAAPLPAPLPEGNALVQSLVDKTKAREEALNDYTYDVLEVKEELDKQGRVSERRSRRKEVFYVKGRAVRRTVEEDGRPLSEKERAEEDRRVREKIEAIQGGRVLTEKPGLRLFQILERYDFRTVGREEVEGRPAFVLVFSPRPGDRDIKGDAVLRTLSGRLWIDESDREVVRLQAKNGRGVKLAFGLGASFSEVDLEMEFRKVGPVWLPLRIGGLVQGRVLLFKRIRTRAASYYSNYRTFSVDATETVQSPQPGVSPGPAPSRD